MNDPEVYDYNGCGIWAADQILERYRRYCDELNITPLDLTPMRHAERNREWIYPVMDKVIDGIKAGDKACIRLGIAFIHEDGSFPFGRILKAKTARALRLRLNDLTDSQKHQIRSRVIGMLSRQYLPRELGEYVKLAAKLGMAARRGELLALDDGDPFVNRHVSKLLAGVTS
ncbi:MAG: hypothetical protein V4675_05570 [Verrucomicrobiota bacterium]